MDSHPIAIGMLTGKPCYEFETRRRPFLFPSCRRRLFSQVDRQDEPIEATEGDVIEQD